MTKHDRTILAAKDPDLAEMSDEALKGLYIATFDAMDDLPMSVAEIAEGHALLGAINAELAKRQPLR